jgi:hypothetical protein
MVRTRGEQDYYCAIFMTASKVEYIKIIIINLKIK